MFPFFHLYHRHRLINLFGICLVLMAVLAFPMPAKANTYVVNSQLDTYDGECDDVHCSLREAIIAANDHPGPDTIWFNIEGGSYPRIITLTADLPMLLDDNTTIDATDSTGASSVVLIGGDSFVGFFVESNGNTIRGFTFTGFLRDIDIGTPIKLVGDNNLIEGNTITNSTSGIIVREGSDNNVIRNNNIGLSSSGTAGPNMRAGIVLYGSGNTIENNRIANNGGEGIAVLQHDALGRNTITQNSIYDNDGLGIDLIDDPVEVSEPLIIDAGLTEITGEACAGCTVELFLAAPDPTDYGEGRTFLGEGTADSSRTFSITLDEALTECDPVTATATDPLGNTSEFALNARAGMCALVEMPALVEPYLTVNTTSEFDDGVCNETHCSLREAINDANRIVGPNTIRFDIPGLVPHRIELTYPLPRLTNDQTTIDGTSEPDYAGSPVVWLVGVEEDVGLYVESQRNTIRGLGMVGFGGVDDSTGWPEATGGGIYLAGGLNTITGNLIVEGGYGMFVASNHNLITGNHIGVNAAGDSAAGNAWDGIIVTGHDNEIGRPGEGNIISGNGRHGINLYNSLGNSVMGNMIGAGADGESAIPNEHTGVFTQGQTIIGGVGSGEGNVIAFNGQHGVDLYDTAMNVTVAGNVIHDNGGYGILVDSMGDGFDTFTQNSIYENGELGIETNRFDDHIAELDRASMTSVSGSVDCNGCTVELFQAAPDPTGYGEGQTYLGETTTDMDGAFEFDLSGVPACAGLTATVTDTNGETSEFSENILVACVDAPGRLLSVVGVSGILILTVVVVILRELGPEAPPWFAPGMLGGGALLVLVLAFVVLWALPGVRLDFGPPSAPLPDPIPRCGAYLDPEGYAPVSLSVLGRDENPRLTWQPGQDAPAGAEWAVELRTADEQVYALTTTDTSVPLSSFPVNPEEGGHIEWTVRLLSEGEAACRPDQIRTLIFENPLFEADTMPPAEAEQPEEVDEPVEEACTPTVTAQMNANCRSGPGTVYGEIAFLLEGESADAIGRSADSTWWVVRMIDTQVDCWVWDGAVEAACTEGLPVIAAPPTPVPPPEEDTTPPPAPSPIAPTGGPTLGCAGSVLLSWDAVTDPSGIAGYTVEVQRSSDQATWSAASGSPYTTDLTKQPIAVECGWYYRWRVRATDGEGNVGSYSGWASFAITLN